MNKIKKIIKCVLNPQFFNSYINFVSPLFELEPLLNKIDNDLQTKFNLDPTQYEMTGLAVLYNNMLQSLFKKNALKQAMNFDVKQILPRYEKLYEKCIGDYLSK